MKKKAEDVKVFKTYQDFVDRIESQRGTDKDINAYAVKDKADTPAKKNKSFKRWLQDQGCSNNEIKEHFPHALHKVNNATKN